MKPLEMSQANQIIRDHGKTLPNGQVFLTKPLGVFKKVKVYTGKDNDKFLQHLANHSIASSGSADKVQAFFPSDWRIDKGDAVANLILPVGTIVNLATSYQKKMRASRAICWSIVNTRNGKTSRYGLSIHDKSFIYIPAHYQGQGSTFGNHDLNSLVHDLSKFDFDLKYKYNLQRSHISPHDFSTAKTECSGGVHFFVESKGAVDY